MVWAFMGGIGAVSGGVGVEARSVGEGVESVVAGGVGTEDIIQPGTEEC
jgi:hypothetical protein